MQLEPVATVDLGTFKPVILLDVPRVDLGDPEPEAPVLPSGELRIERTAREELEATRTAIGEAFKQQRDAFNNATDSVYWICACFQSRAQLVEWLTKSGLMQEIDGQYIDGRKVAEKMGIKLEAPSLPKRTHKVDRRLAELANE